MFHATGRRLLGASLLASCLVFAQANGVRAADDAGQFAIKGAGQQSCAAFLKALDERSRDLGLYAGWVDGYLTGLNQFTEDTYDLAAWQGTDTLLGLTQAVCVKAPEGTRFIDAFFQIVRAMGPSRLTDQSPMIALVHEGRTTVAYGVVVERMKRRLTAMGHGEGLPADTVFDAATVAALASFQTEEGLPVTGLPDQRTLFALFRSR